MRKGFLDPFFTFKEPPVKGTIQEKSEETSLQGKMKTLGWKFRFVKTTSYDNLLNLNSLSFMANRREYLEKVLDQFLKGSL